MRLWAALGCVVIGCAIAPEDGRGRRPTTSQRAAVQGGALDLTSTAVVSVLLTDGRDTWVCSGSLIAPNLVLTAQHCVADSPSAECQPSNQFGPAWATSSFAVTTSATASVPYYSQGTFPAIDGATWFGVRAVWVPGSAFCGDDLALLELSASIPGVCPLVPRVDQAVSGGEPYEAVGFGATSPTGFSAGTRYRVGGLAATCAIQCGSDAHATKEWEGGATDARGVCEGDSGGPALDTQGRVIGTLSRVAVDACNEATYESVFAHATWLKQQASVAAADGHYPPPAWAQGQPTAGLRCGAPGSDAGVPPADAGLPADGGFPPGSVTVPLANAAGPAPGCAAAGGPWALLLAVMLRRRGAR